MASSEEVEFERVCEGLSSLSALLTDLRPEASKVTLLNLHGNKLVDLDGLPRLPKLKTLILSSNNISSCDMTELPTCISLTSLDLSSNRLRSIADLPFLPGLERLYLSFNLIESLTGIDENCPNLQVLDVRGNLLRSPAALLPLRGLTSLSSLQFCSVKAPNPLCDDISKMPFLSKLFELVPNLCLLDDKPENHWLELSVRAQGLIVDTPKFDRVLERMKMRWAGPAGSGDGGLSALDISEEMPRAPIRPASIAAPAPSTQGLGPAPVQNQLYLTINALDNSISARSEAEGESASRGPLTSSLEGLSNNVHVHIQPTAIPAYPRGRGYEAFEGASTPESKRPAAREAKSEPPAESFVPAPAPAQVPVPVVERPLMADAEMQCEPEEREEMREEAVQVQVEGTEGIDAETNTSFEIPEIQAPINEMASQNVSVDSQDNFSRSSSSSNVSSVEVELAEAGANTDIIETQSAAQNTSFVEELLPLRKAALSLLGRQIRLQKMGQGFATWRQFISYQRWDQELESRMYLWRAEFLEREEAIQKQHAEEIQAIEERHGAEIASLNSDIGLQREEISRLQEIRDNQKAEIDWLKKEIETNRTEHQTFIANKDIVIEACQGQIRELSLRLASADDVLEAEKKLNRERMEAVMAQAAKDKDSLGKEHSATIASIQAKNAKRIDLLKSIIDELKSTASEQELRDQTLTAKNEEFAQLVADMKNVVKQQKAEIDRLKTNSIETKAILENERRQRAEETASNASILAARDTHIANLQRELDNMRHNFESELGRKQEQVARSSQSQSKVEATVSDLYRRLEQAEGEMKSLYKEINNLRRSEQEKTLSLKVKEKLLNDFESVVGTNKIKIGQLEREKAALESKVSSLEFSGQQLRDELDLLEGQLRAKSGAEEDLMELLEKIGSGEVVPGKNRDKGKGRDKGGSRDKSRGGRKEYDDSENAGSDEEYEHKQGDGRSSRRGSESESPDSGIGSLLVCSKRTCRQHLAQLELELQLKDEVIGELKAQLSGKAI